MTVLASRPAVIPPTPFQLPRIRQDIFRRMCSGAKGVPILQVRFRQLMTLRFKAADARAGVPPAAAAGPSSAALRKSDMHDTIKPKPVDSARANSAPQKAGLTDETESGSL
jgi:hypothetical protein